MQIKITITLASESKPFRVVDFHGFGSGALDTLSMVASGIQVTAQVTLTFDRINVLTGTGRDFIEFVKQMEVAQ